jgi:hypothetical protein
MKISKLNIAVLIQFAGLLALGLSHSNVVRLVGVVVIVVGGVLYRREQKRLKTAQPIPQTPPPADRL